MYENATQQYAEFLLEKRPGELQAAIEDARKLESKMMEEHHNDRLVAPGREKRVMSLLSQILAGTLLTNGEWHQSNEHDGTSVHWRIPPNEIEPILPPDGHQGPYWDESVNMEEVAAIVMSRS